MTQKFADSAILSMTDIQENDRIIIKTSQLKGEVICIQKDSFGLYWADLQLDNGQLCRVRKSCLEKIYV